MNVESPNELKARVAAARYRDPQSVSELVELILDEAVARSVSDVHFDPTHRCVEVRFRIDGVLQPVAELKRDLAPNLVARLKVQAELLTYRLDIPQEGRLAEASQRYGVDMRVSTFPTIHGEKVVVRVFDPSGRMIDLEQIGLTPDLFERLTTLLKQRNKALLLTGPSGSGKTTTIYACLAYLVRTTAGGRHIVTIEDPVEQVIEGVSQSQARPGREFDFARGLRSLLRQDPEVIMIGEVRDRETAEIAIEAALTGHLVISTVHTGSACGVVGRLLDMGIEPYLLTSGLNGILNQRLVRRLCPACRVRATPRGGLVASGAEPTWVARGCAQCNGTGYRGRMLLAELVTLDEPLRQAVLARSDTQALEAATAHSERRTIRSAAAEAISEGHTSVEEIERVLGPAG